jgi:MFS family permease
VSQAASGFRQEAAVIGLVSAAHGMSHFFQLVAAPLFPFMKDELGVSYAALGFLVVVLYTVSGVVQPLAGFVVDRYGARLVLIGGLALMALGTLMLALAPGYGVLVAGAAIAGLGNSVFHPADYAILNERVSTRRLGHAYSSHGVTGFIGYAVAPMFGVGVASLVGWRGALAAGAALGALLLVVLLLNPSRLETASAERAAGRVARPVSAEIRMLLSPAILFCFVYFTLYATAFIGIQSFGVAAMTEQYGVAAALASSALSAYYAAVAAGVIAGGFAAARTARHDLVTAAGVAGGALVILVVAMKLVPGSALPAAFAVSGFLVGLTGPSRDMIVRAATPPGASGKVFGFVYSGLDVGSMIMPALYGWMLDNRLPQGVFYAVAIMSFAAVLTVIFMPGRARQAPAPGT